MNHQPIRVAIALATLLLCCLGARVATGQPPQDTPPAMPAVVRYSDFGAVGDGKADDFEAIARAHDHANRHGLPVQADDGGTYFIGGEDRTVVIQTDVDFGDATFVIDDTAVENRSADVFEVRSMLEQVRIGDVPTLKAGQERISLALPHDSLVVVNDSNVRRFIRFGANQNDGNPQTDVFIVKADGTVDPATPIIWDFEQVTSMTARPIDVETLTISGGRFVTIANAEESRYNYYARGIGIRRSNVVVEGLEHRVTGEGEHGAPYAGFLNVRECANVTIRDTVLTGRQTYRTIGSAGLPVSMGSYDLNINLAVNVSLVGITQDNDINDTAHWGIMGTNYTKNLLLERCSLSRFDAHMGVTNATIRDSTLGHMGIRLIGNGTFLMEGTTVKSRNLISLRSDYGSTWRGDIIVRDCVLEPTPRGRAVALIAGHNSGQHDFGYTCHMPAQVTIDGLHIDDAPHPDDYRGPAIFGNFNPAFDDPAYTEKFPYVKSQRVVMRGVTTASGKPLRLSDNEVMFRDVILVREDPE